MAASYLPVELWLIILSLARFSPNDLAALCLVCTGFYHALVDHLYDSIMVDNCNVCTTLADCPRLAQKVKSFVVTYPRLITDDKNPRVHLQNLTLALKNMTSLSMLKLIHSREGFSHVLRYCYAELHVFHCSYDMGRQLLRFLNRQKNIRHLAVTGNWPKDIKPKWLKSISLPHLTEVSANHEWLWNFLRGRPVHTVHGVRVEGETAILSRSASPLRNLGIDLTAWRDPCVQPWTGLGVEHVQEITLTGFFTFTRRAGMLPRCFPSLRRMLKAMPDLKRLTFWIEGKHDECRKLAEILFWEFDYMLPRLEQASCVVVEPDMLTTVGYFKEGRNSNIIVDTRGHRVAGDVRELMPLPILCRWNEKQLCDRNTYNMELQYYN